MSRAESVTLLPIKPLCIVKISNLVVGGWSVAVRYESLFAICTQKSKACTGHLLLLAFTYQCTFPTAHGIGEANKGFG